MLKSGRKDIDVLTTIAMDESCSQNNTAARTNDKVRTALLQSGKITISYHGFLIVHEAVGDVAFKGKWTNLATFNA